MKMTVQKKIKSHPDVMNYFKELSFIISTLKHQNLNV